MNISLEICRQIRSARKEARLSQGEVAQFAGCKQSQISALENGNITKINDEAIRAIAQKFGIELNEAVSEASLSEISTPSFPNFVTPSPHTGFCPNPHCPSNHRYQVEDLLFIKPDRTVADPVGGKFCALCGERLERKCGNCGAPVHEGAICSICGEPYVAL